MSTRVAYALRSNQRYRADSTVDVDDVKSRGCCCHDDVICSTTWLPPSVMRDVRLVRN